ncbi:MAG: MBL fold metallo-hydrolase [Myxococcales bacterium]
MRLALVFALVASLGGACSCRRPAPGQSSVPSASSASSSNSGSHALPSPASAGEATVHVVDVGTGLAIFVEGPDFTLVYDAGSNDDLRDERHNRFIAYLRAVRPTLRAIDHVILSHAHRDHVELLADVVSKYEVREVWEPGVLYKPCAYLRFLKAVSEKPNIVYHTAASPPGSRSVELPKATCGVQGELRLPYGSRITAGMKVPLGASGFMTFLHVDDRRRDDINANSLVVRLDLLGSSVLLAGDAEAGKRALPTDAPLGSSVEGKLLACCRASIDTDVLVVGHHGSKTSSRTAFLDAVSPSISVISAGPFQYDHVQLPDIEVVTELSRRGKVFRTDLNDSTCATQREKIGRDADGHAGGCDNVRVTLRQGQPPRAAYWTGHD